MLETADERGCDVLRISGEFDGSKPGQQFGEEAAHLQSCQCSTEAEVNAVAEGDVLVGISSDVEPERVVEHILVAVT